MRYNRDKIKDKIKEEINIYGQHQPCPKSKTVVETHDGKQYWRHYEFGVIYGFVLFNEYVAYRDEKPEEMYRIIPINKDDENWSISPDSMTMDIAWFTAVNNTWQRIVKWRNKHLIQGWGKSADITDPGQYVHKQKEPIGNETIQWDDVPDNAVLNTKYTYIENED